MARQPRGLPPEGKHLYRNPVEDFAQLPAATRAFLEALDEEDLVAFTDLVVSYQRAKTIGWFFKWLFLSMVGAFMAAVAFGEAVSKAVKWLSPWSN